MKPDNLNSLKEIEPPATLREIVQERMREAIIKGIFKPNERLVERPLCDKFGVSRTVIRETFRYLEAEGLVEIIPHKGPIVAPIDWSHAKQIYDIRKQLESSAVVACAEKSTAKFKKALQSSISKIEKALSSQDQTEIIKATTGFYKQIFEQAEHHIAWEIVQRLNGRISRLRMLTLATADRHTSGLAHIKNIQKTILSQDPKAAKQAVETHLNDAAAIAKKLLKIPQNDL
jgi:DNA-binding GntR family transcriptional regulator